MPDSKRSLRVDASLANLDAVRAFIANAATTLGIPEELHFYLQLAADEAFTNLVMYGYAGQVGEAELTLSRDPDAVVLTIRDWSRPFDPTQVPPPDLNRPLSERTIGGLGIHIIRQIMDEMHYRADAVEGNVLTLVKRLPKE
ncbi:MAG TPA: ATP-binding protein [Anaerolineae bacterium]|nr:ATP-binding protein [Anaerolineae bacterium]HIQ04607.1 ATP-binding protein [Anaerolineae bacterium]